ncbi:hypothetical protein GCM10009733_006770 [Nonomuraea maheshkhaliensis]|uniref:Type II toxin-antitoxin system VapC family toxin n=1 Tax=Nonomuraea maheshkhaliensis TaxID=419590 RepID=A0ABP4QPH1_9ACTN
MAWGRRTSPFVDATIWARAEHAGYVVPLVTTGPAVAAALAQLPESAAPIVDALLSMDVTIVDEVGRQSAPGVAALLRPRHAAYAEQGVTAASVVLAAKRRGLPVVTANPLPLTALGADVEIDLIP